MRSETASAMGHDTFLSELHALKETIPFSSSLTPLRQKSWHAFEARGLPTRKSEAYRTIKLRHLFNQDYCSASFSSLTADQIHSWVLPECRHSVIVCINGHFSPTLSCLEAIPTKVVLSSLEEAVASYGILLQNRWAHYLKEEVDPFALLNGALHPSGLFLYLPPRVAVEAPVQLLHIAVPHEGHSSSETLFIAPRLQLFAGAHSQLKLVTTHHTTGKGRYWTNQFEDFLLEEGAHLHYTQCVWEEGAGIWHFDACRAVLKRNSVLKTVCLTEGGDTIRHDYSIALEGEGAEASLIGGWQLNGKREAHVHVSMDHRAPHCRSHQLFKGVLADTSRASFTGKIIVRQAAQKTEAFQLNHNLLLGEQAHVDSTPNLEIFADDVKASHGATIGQLDPDQLFYMKTRGLSSSQARHLLLQGFFEEIIAQASLPSIRDQLRSRLVAALIGTTA